MPQLRKTAARLESARRLASANLLRYHQYAWSPEDQREFDESLKWLMHGEWWSSTNDMADHLVMYVLAFGRVARPTNVELLTGFCSGD
jgi:hypothetical protein